MIEQPALFDLPVPPNWDLRKMRNLIDLRFREYEWMLKQFRMELDSWVNSIEGRLREANSG